MCSGVDRGYTGTGEHPRPNKIYVRKSWKPGENPPAGVLKEARSSPIQTFTVGSGIKPDLSPAYAGGTRGLYRRSGVAPCPEERNKCINLIQARQ